MQYDDINILIFGFKSDVLLKNKQTRYSLNTFQVILNFLITDGTTLNRVPLEINWFVNN